MSSAPTAGPPPNRPSSSNGGGPAGASRAMNGANNGNASPLKITGRVFPHIDDLRVARPDVNIHSPIRTLLLQCESHAKQAETRLDFGRPDLALEEYIKASILLVEIIPRHKDYPQLKSDRGDLHRLFGGLQKRISSQYQKFEEVKDIIKENNARNGVVSALRNGHPTISTLSQRIDSTAQNQSTVSSAHIAASPFDALQDNGTNSRLNGAPVPPSTPLRNGEPPITRQKPHIQPKPDALHGKSIKPIERPAPPEPSKTEEDLAARFARLRGSDSHSSSTVQDPRIRTQPIGMPGSVNITKGAVSPTSTSSTHVNSYQPRSNRLSGPRDMPQAPRPLRSPKNPLDLNIPSMPRAPDAIYSPARNFDNPANIDMPRTTARSMFGVTGRQNSTSTPTAIGMDSRKPSNTSNFESRSDYFALTPSVSNDAKLKLVSQRSLPDSTAITAEELMDYLKQARILLVDIRAREDFDSGHIMCQNIICIEPIVLRKGMSAEDLAQSLVLSPEAEQRIFNERDTFDLIVYYDASSSDLHANASNYGHETALADFSKAVYDYGYEKRSKQRPMLLTGGLDSWVDLLGQGALKTSMTVSGPSRTSHKPYGQLPHRRAPTARRPTYESRPLTKEEEYKWEQTIKNENLRADEFHGSPSSLWSETPDESYFVRTTEDFVRRFPEASAIPESMISPLRAHDQSAYIAAAHQDELNSMMPKIPARPPPALPRQSYTGVSDRGPSAVTTSYKPRPVAGINSISGTVDTISRPVGYRNHCGLTNPGNLCYMNSVLQGLSSTIPFAEWLLQYDFLDPARQAPRKKKERGDSHPQLMAKNLANLLRHLWSQRFSHVSPNTLRNYIFAVAKARDDNTETVDALGGSRQQDAQELLDFLLDILEDETNMRRNVEASKPLPDATVRAQRLMSPLKASILAWQNRIETLDSPMYADLFGSQTLTTIQCGKCTYYTRNFEPQKYHIIDVPKKGTATLEQCLARTFGRGAVDWKCDECQSVSEVHHTKQVQLTHGPRILILVLRRGGWDTSGPVKFTGNITFNQDLDMAPYFIDLNNPREVEAERTDHTKPPFKYRCYAVVQHVGRNVRSGHYWTIAKDQVKDQRDSKWYKFNDQTMEHSSWSATQTNETYMIFYERQGNR